MNAEGDTEMRDLITQNLQSSGFLNKIKAELRAGVIIALKDEGSLETKHPLFNKTFHEFKSTSNGNLAVSLVREFLEYFNLNFTLSVFDPETSTSSPCLNRTDLCDKLSLKSSELKGPVLSAFLKMEVLNTGKQAKQQSNGINTIAHSTPASSLNSKKTLETISEDDHLKAKAVETTKLSTTLDVGNNSLNRQTNQKSGSEMIDKLRNEHHSYELHRKEISVSDIFGTDKSDTNIFKVNANPSNNLDTFLDNSLPTQKGSFFGENGLGLSQNKMSESELSSSKFLPAITTTKSNDWSFSRELPGALSNLDLAKSSKKTEVADGAQNKVEGDPESNEESSDRLLNSAESTEEDFSGELEELLNSSLSLADDTTSDQSASEISVVDGVDHIEPVTN